MLLTMLLLQLQMLRGTPIDSYIEQVRGFQEICRNNKINIDYFPTNFVVHNNDLFYVDYELNEYSEQYNFDNWGIKYYNRNSPEFIQYLSSINS